MNLAEEKPELLKHVVDLILDQCVEAAPGEKVRRGDVLFVVEREIQLKACMYLRIAVLERMKARGFEPCISRGKNFFRGARLKEA